MEPERPPQQTAALEEEWTVKKPVYGPFYAMRFRNFRLFFIGQLISVAGTWMQIVAQSWLIWTITHSPAWLGIISGTSAIPYVLFSLWGGQVADRHSRRVILIWTQTIPMILAFIQAALAANIWVHIQAWHIAVLSAMLGVVNAFNMPAQQAFVVDIVDHKEAMGNAIALNSFRFNIARFLGPILAGVVLVKLGASMCFFLNGLSFLAVIISLFMMRIGVEQAMHRENDVWGGFRYIMENHTALRVISLIGCGSLFAWSASTLFPVFAASYHEGAKGYSSMMAYNGIGAAIGGIFIASFGSKYPRMWGIYWGAILYSFSLFLFAGIHNYQVSLALLVLSGFAMIMFAINSNTKVQEDVPNVLRGRVMAAYSLVFGGLMPVGGLEAGFLAEKIGAPHTVALNAALCLVAALAMYVWGLLEKNKEEIDGKKAYL
jgi:MFS family permease